MADPLRQVFDADEPVVIRMRHEPHPASARLLVALGAGWIVDETAPPFERRCGRKECLVSASAVNQGLRLARGEHGQIVVTAAFCGHCKREVMPTDHGTCVWCGQQIVDEDLLPAKQLLERLERGETTWSAEQTGADFEEAVPDPVDVKELASRPENGRRRRRSVYDVAEIEKALLRFQEEHGREPTFADIKDCEYLPRPPAAIAWRDAALRLGWSDPTTPKRGPRARAIGAAKPEANGGPPGPGPGGSSSPRARVAGFTVDELWTLYEAALAQNVPVEIRSKLRHAIQEACV